MISYGNLICGLGWAALTLLAIFLTQKYYIPMLAQRTGREEAAPNLPRIRGGRDYGRILEAAALIGIAVFSFFCGCFTRAVAVDPAAFAKILLAFMVLTVSAVTDARLQIIPNPCPVVMLVGKLLIGICELVFLKAEPLALLINSFSALLIALIFLLIMAKLSGGGIGMGDVKLFSALGFLCGLAAFCITLLFSFVLCALFSIPALIMKKKGLKDALPLGPFILIAFGLSILFSMI